MNPTAAHLQRRARHLLAKRARRQYLFREEFIFEVSNGVAVATPPATAGVTQLIYSASLAAWMPFSAFILTSAKKTFAATGKTSRCSPVSSEESFTASTRGAWLKELRARLGELVLDAQGQN